eukprot:scaffold6298_cov151-Isochrysis_galbana.AAC.3
MSSGLQLKQMNERIDVVLHDSAVAALRSALACSITARCSLEISDVALFAYLTQLRLQCPSVRRKAAPSWRSV